MTARLEPERVKGKASCRPIQEELNDNPYLILPVDLLDEKRLPILGWLDEITSLAVAIQRMGKYITPEMEVKVDGILDQWFPIYAEFEKVKA